MKNLIAIFFFSLLFISINAQPIIIDHNCIDYNSIPVSWINQAKANLLIGYGHTSHGSQPVSGMNALGTFNSDFYFEGTDWGLEPGVFFNDYWGNAGGAEDLGHNGDLAWRDATIDMLELPDNDRNVVIWSWCGGCSDNTPEGISTYLNAMDALENQYPDVTFVYMTGHLDGTGADETLNASNEQIRQFCIDNDKILFDFADIESYDPDALVNYMPLLANDGCWYDSDGDGDFWDDANWAMDWCDDNPDHEYTIAADYCEECAHSENLNCLLKAGAFWWMFARITGWDGTVPVELTSFTGIVNDNGVVLKWTTATEINNKGFEIERASFRQDGTTPRQGWEKIDFVEGCGNSASPKQYLFTDKNPSPGKILYRLKQIDFDGSFEYSDIVEVTVELPKKFKLLQNYPNPFNPTTTIKYSVSNKGEAKFTSPTNVQLKVYDILGRTVATLVNEEQPPGNYEVSFDPTNILDNKRGLTNGIYLYRLQAGKFSQTKKMTLLK